MNGKRWFSIGILAGITLAAGSVVAQSPAPEHLGGLISDYTPLNPNSGTAPTGPYEMRGRWSVQFSRDGRKADFSVFMDMELSDYWIWHANADATDPNVRGAHTHHITLTDVAVTYNPTTCPTDSPATMARFMISGSPTIATGNGSPGSFVAKGPSTLTVCVTGGSSVEYSNMTMMFSGTATGHFGSQAIHGVVRFPKREEERRDDWR